MSIGWGIIAVVFGFLSVAVAGAWQWRQFHYSPET
jgi:hypothetical protein